VSLIPQLLQDPDGQRQLPAGAVSGYAEEEDSNQRVVIWPAVVVSLLSAALVIHFSNYFYNDTVTINTAALPVIPTVQTVQEKVSESAQVELVREMPAGEVRTSEAAISETGTSLLTDQKTGQTEAMSAVVLDIADAPVSVEPEVTEAPVQLAVLSEPEPFSEPEPAAFSDAAMSDGQTKRGATPEITDKPQPKATVSKSAGKAAAVPVKTPKATIERSRNAEDYYHRAVSYYSNGDWRTALAEADKARELGGSIDYPALQARIYVENGMRDEFVALFEQYGSNTSMQWLTTVAPGLHMFSMYGEAADKYSVLMSQDPENVQWALAKVQALIDAGNIRTAINELKLMPENYTLTLPQQAWVDYQMDALE